MKRILQPLLLLGLVCLAGEAAHASGVITNCAEADLAFAVASGGNVSFGENCSITLTQPIRVSGNVTITSSNYNVTLSGGGKTNLFYILSGKLTLIGLNLIDGRAPRGGAIYVGTNGTLLATNCTFSGNNAAGTNGTDGLAGADNANGVGGDGTAGAVGVSAQGAAIYNAGTLTLLNCTLATNAVVGGDGGAGGNGGNGGGDFSQGGNGGSGGAGGTALGGAVYNLRSFTAYNCTFAGNSASGGKGGAGGANGSGTFPSEAGNGGAGGVGSGAGVYNGKYMTLSGCTFSGNTSVGGASANGGTQANGSGASGPNGADALGAGLSSINWGVATNCTFYDDMVIGGDAGNGGNGTSGFAEAGSGGNGGNGLGGAVYNSGTFTFVNCTVANSAAVGGTNGVAGSGSISGSSGQVGLSLGGGLANRGTFTLKNSLFSTNTPGGNLNGSFSDAGHNLSSDTSFKLGSTSFNGTDPKLAGLGAYGGYTRTMALLPSSPAIDAVGNNPADFPPTDQRGVHRPQGAGADIGAYELSTFPAILQDPQSLGVPAGGTATFTVSATGAGLGYQWRFNGTPIASAANSAYSIGNVSITNAGSYDVVVTNLFGAVTSAPAILTVGPQIVTAPTNQEVAVGTPAKFIVNVAGSGTLAYQWYFDATNLLSGANAAAYTIASAQTNQVGAYTVVVTNAVGSVTSSPAMLVVDAILVQPASQTVAVGSNVTLSVVASGTGLNYQWRLNGNDISGAKSPSYTFTAVKSDAGQYDVHAFNSVVSMRSAPATLTVLAPPVITNAPPSSLSVTQGQGVTLAAGATGDGVAYQWFFQGAPLAGATASSFSLPAAQLSDAGTYTLKVTNLVATASSTTALRVLVPTTILSVSVRSNWVTLVYPTETNLSYVLQYKTNLVDPVWTGLMDTLGTGTLVTNEDTLTNPPVRFYRVLVK